MIDNPDTTSRLTLFRRSLSPAEWTAPGGMVAFIEYPDADPLQETELIP
ncbi:MAG TPA: hypothetical protein VN327_17295 [Pseudonocardiaceae bacterium]|jgi:ADP-ribose pyrophosphatase YjhB (NUDIX family)|nr:hypothetical protein [Pseudonocardiaceae bacterium]